MDIKTAELGHPFNPRHGQAGGSATVGRHRRLSQVTRSTRVERDPLVFLYYMVFRDLKSVGDPGSADPGGVGGYRTIHHTRPQSPGGRDNDSVVVALHRVHGKADTGALGVDQGENQNRHRLMAAEAAIGGSGGQGVGAVE